MIDNNYRMLILEKIETFSQRVVKFQSMCKCILNYCIYLYFECLYSITIYTDTIVELPPEEVLATQKQPFVVERLYLLTLTLIRCWTHSLEN
jgi:hypothetical protein